MESIVVKVESHNPDILSKAKQVAEIRTKPDFFVNEASYSYHAGNVTKNVETFIIKDYFDSIDILDMQQSFMIVFYLKDDRPMGRSYWKDFIVNTIREITEIGAQVNYG